MYHYKVIPLAKIALSRSPYFIYGSKEKIPFGSLVQISFGKKQLRGVSFEETSKPRGFHAKEIQKIIVRQAIDKSQLQLALFLSRYYYCPLGTVLRFFIPPSAKKAKQKKLVRKKDGNKIMLTKSQKSAVKKIIEGKPGGEFVLLGPSSSGKTEVMLSLAEKYAARDEQSLILVPDIFLAYQEIGRYQKRFGSLVVLMHSKMPKNEYLSGWEKIKSGSAKVILSTRMGVFLPFSKLGLIAVDEEQDSSHKSWDQSPRYSDKVAARELCRIHGSKLVFCSATPSLETLANKNAAQILLPPLRTDEFEIKNPDIEIVDLRKDYFKRKNYFFSQQLLDKISNTLETSGQSLILVPRRGKSRAVICQGCKKILKCKNCNLPLASVGDSFKCLHCSYKLSTLSKCPACGGFNLKSIGFGTEKIALELKKIFPGAKISAADRETFQKEKDREKIFNDLANGRIDILVGTTTMIKGLDLKNISLAAVISDSGWAGKNEFEFDEKYLGSLFQLAGRLNRPGSGQNGIFTVQTWNPQNKLLKYLENWDWLGFSKDELKQRKALNFPPFCFLIKLTAIEENLKKLEKKADLAYDKLSKIGKDEIFDTLAPYFGSIKKIRNRWQKNLLIKVKNPHSRKLSKILGEMSKEWIIDIGPENVF